MQKGLEVLNCFAFRSLEGVRLRGYGPALPEGLHLRPAWQVEVGCADSGWVGAIGEVVLGVVKESKDEVILSKVS
jgi:hypothetical protein